MEEDQPLCLICYDLLENKNNYILPECKHKYHTECIIEWFKTGDNRCPYCQNKGINNQGEKLNYNLMNTGMKIHAIVSPKTLPKTQICIAQS